jgi:hypothetical protein
MDTARKPWLHPISRSAGLENACFGQGEKQISIYE